jgi:predicted nucleic acid-binding protein
MLIVDANIIFPLLVATPQTKDVRTLYSKDSNWRTEPFAMIELSQVLVKYVRASLLSPTDVRQVLPSAREFIEEQFLEVDHEEALAVAIKYNVSAYDARYLALAIQSELPLVTEDKRLRAAAPEITVSLAEALAG